MKTPDEIKKGLECCPGQYFGVSCGNCLYSNDGVYCGENGVRIMKDALEYIEQLESNWNQVSKTLCGNGNATLENVLQAVSQLKKRLQAYEESAIKCCYESRCNKEINALNEYCALVDKELEAVKRERDALMLDFQTCVKRTRKVCSVCSNKGKPICNTCEGCDVFEWRYVCNENTEVQE